MGDVVKRDGKKEPFNAEKIRRSIEKAFIDAGESLEDKREEIEDAASRIINELQDRNDLDTKAIRDRILKELEGFQDSAADAWRRFDSKYKAARDAIHD